MKEGNGSKSRSILGRVKKNPYPAEAIEILGSLSAIMATVGS